LALCKRNSRTEEAQERPEKLHHDADDENRDHSILRSRGSMKNGCTCSSQGGFTRRTKQDRRDEAHGSLLQAFRVKPTTKYTRARSALHSRTYVLLTRVMLPVLWVRHNPDREDPTIIVAILLVLYIIICAVCIPTEQCRHNLQPMGRLLCS
jgi:hypothetical protein